MDSGLLVVIALFLSVVPAAVDDYIDYLVNDVTWIPSIPIVLYTILNGLEWFYPFILFLIFIFTPFTISRILRRSWMGEADVILFFIYIFYSPLISNHVDFNSPLASPTMTYLIILILNSLYGLLYSLFSGKHYSPIVFFAIPTFATLAILIFIL